MLAPLPPQTNPDTEWNGTAFVRRGREQNREETRAALDVVLAGYSAEMGRVSQQLRDGDITLAEWELLMVALVLQVHLTAVALAVGGWEQMTAADYRDAEEAAQQQTGYLVAFAAGIAAGAVALDGRFLARARMYGQAGRGTYYLSVTEVMRRTGYTQERRLLGDADHCDDCIRYEAMGWQPLGTLPAIGGQSVCRVNCKCRFEYR